MFLKYPNFSEMVRTMKKAASVPESAKGKAKALKTVKVTVLMPVESHRKFSRLATKERRSMSTQVLVLAERGMAAGGGSPA